jgi:WD40 repeat protein
MLTENKTPITNSSLALSAANNSLINEFSIFNPNNNNNAAIPPTHKYLTCPTCKTNIIQITSFTQQTTPSFTYTCPQCSSSTTTVTDYITHLNTPINAPQCKTHPHLTSHTYCMLCSSSLCEECSHMHNTLLPFHIPFTNTNHINLFTPRSSSSSSSLWHEMKSMLTEIESLAQLEQFIALHKGKLTQFKETIYTKIDALIDKLLNLKDIISYELETFAKQTSSMYDVIKVMFDNYYMIKDIACNESIINSMKALNFNTQHKYFNYATLDKVLNDVECVRLDVARHFNRNTIVMLPKVWNTQIWVSKVVELPGGYIVAACGDNNVYVYDVRKMKVCAKVAMFVEENCYGMCYDNDKKRVVIGTDQCNVFGYDVEVDKAGKVMLVFSYVKENVHCDNIHAIIKLTLLNSKDNSGVYATASADKSIKIWNETFTKQYQHIMKAHDLIINDIIEYKQQSTTLCSYVISISNDRSIKLWKIEMNKHTLITTVKHAHDDEIYGVVELSARRFASCARDASVKVWCCNELRNVKCLYTVTQAHSACVYCICRLNDDNVVTCSDDGVMKIWDDVHGFKCVRRVFAHEKEIVGVLQLGSGEIVTYGEDNTIRIWEY